MKILLLSHSLNDPNSGASRVYHTLNSGLTSLGHEVSIYHFDDFKVPKNSLLRKIILRIFFPQFIKFRLKKIQFEKIDVIISSSGMGCAVYRKLASMNVRTLLLSHIHGLSFFDHQANLFEFSAKRQKLSFLYRFISAPLTIFWENQAATFSNITVVQNNRDYDFLFRAGVQKAKLIKIEPAIIDQILQSGITVEPKDRPATSLLWFGSWTARKGCYTVPEAFERILDQEPDSTLTIGGAGDLESVVRASFSARANKNISYLAKLSVSEQLKIFDNCSIILFPSISEGFGLALLEAMSQKLAAVTTDTGVGGDWIEHGESALLVPKASSVHLANATVRLIRDRSLRLKIAESGSILARSFTEARMIALYDQAIRSTKEDRLRSKT